MSTTKCNRGLAVFIFMLSVARACADTPLGTALTYQGRLSSAGAPVNGPHDLQFHLWNHATDTGPAALVSGPICIENLNVQDGLFTVTLDFGAAFQGDERWLEIGVRADSTLNNCADPDFIYTTLAPRQSLTAVPYALHTRGIDGHSLDADDGNPTDALYVDYAGRVGIGTTTPSDRLSIAGGNANDIPMLSLDQSATEPRFSLRADLAGNPDDRTLRLRSIVFNTDIMTWRADGRVGVGSLPIQKLDVAGTIRSSSGGFMFPDGTVQTTAATGGAGFWSANGSDIFNNNSGNVGIGTLAPGHRLEVNSAGSRTIFSQNSATSGTRYAVFGQADSSSGRGVFGLASATTGTNYGIYGEAKSSAGTGVFGWHSQTTGTTPGVHGVSDAVTEGTQTNGVTGVLGSVSSATAGAWSAGVRGINNYTGSNGAGVIGIQSGNGHGVYGEASGTSSSGVSGYASAFTGLVYGGSFSTPSTGGVGVAGFSTASSGSAYGVRGDSGSPSGAGVYGTNSAFSTVWPPASAVYGYASSTTGSNAGVFGETASGSGNGVYGVASSENGPNAVGVSGFKIGGGIAVKGRALDGAPGTASYGGYFTSAGYEGSCGVYAETNLANTSVTFGVHARSTSPNGIGVFGYGGNGVGGGAAYGVYGQTHEQIGWGGFFDRLNAGFSSAAVKAFMIDHPLDPENKYLQHSSVESPDMKNIYDGVATLDESGEAWIELPNYFQSLNRDFRYQLTAIGASMPGLFIGREISDNRFQIAGGKPCGRVSWQVTGIRQDAAANHLRIVVEKDKPQLLHGKYVVPEAYGLPKERGIHYRANPERQASRGPLNTQAPAATRNSSTNETRDSMAYERP